MFWPAVLARCENCSHKDSYAGLPPCPMSCFEWTLHTFTLICLTALANSSIGYVRTYIFPLESWSWHQHGREIIKPGKCFKVVRLTDEVTWHRKPGMNLSYSRGLMSWSVFPGKKRLFWPRQKTHKPLKKHRQLCRVKFLSRKIKWRKTPRKNGTKERREGAEC